MRKIKYCFAVIALILSIVFTLPISALADDIFTTGGTVSPEKDIYYVGDTVEITDYFRNKGTVSATSVSVEYYHRLDGANSVYSGSPISMGTIAGGASETHSYTYTFKESDVGEYRIGSKITYTLSGAGPYQEYALGHDFTVMPSPTPSATPSSTLTATPTASFTPTPTPSPTAEPTQEPTSEQAPGESATEMPTPIPTFTPKPEETQASEASQNRRNAPITLSSLLKNKVVVVVLIILMSALLSVLIVIIIVAVTKKRGPYS